MTGCTVRRDEVNGILIYSDFFTRVSLACEIEGYTGGSPGTLYERMTEKVFISRLRTLRNHLQERLYKCENQDLRDKITRKLEMYNIMLEEFGYPAYVRKKPKK